MSNSVDGRVVAYVYVPLLVKMYSTRQKKLNRSNGTCKVSNALVSLKLHPSNVQVTSKLHFSSGEVTHKSR